MKVPRILQSALVEGRPLDAQLAARWVALLDLYGAKPESGFKELCVAMIVEHHGAAFEFGPPKVDARQSVSEVPRLRRLIDQIKSGDDVTGPDAHIALKVIKRLKDNGGRRSIANICAALARETGHAWSGTTKETIRANYNARRAGRGRREWYELDHKDLIARMNASARRHGAHFAKQAPVEFDDAAEET